MRRILVWGLLVAVGLVVYVQAQGGGGRGRGGGMRALFFEGEWAMLCFELQVEGEQLDGLRSAYQEAWEARKLLMEDMSAGIIDRQLMREESEQIQAGIQAAKDSLLTAEQLEQLDKLQQAQRQSFQGGGGGRSGQ